MATQLPKNANPPIFTPQTAAEYLQATPRQVYDAVRRKRITHVKVGQNIRFRQSDLDAFLEANTVHAADQSRGVLS